MGNIDCVLSDINRYQTELENLSKRPFDPTNKSRDIMQETEEFLELLQSFFHLFWKIVFQPPLYIETYYLDKSSWEVLICIYFQYS